MLKQLFAVSLTLLFLVGCAGGTDEFQISTTNPNPATNPNPTTNPNPNPTSGPTGTVQGKITAINNTPIAQALVTAGNQTGRTNEEGFFVITNVPVNAQFMVNVSHANHTDNSRQVSLTENSVTRIDMQLGNIGGTRSFNSTDGVRVTANGATVELPAGAYIDASGAAYAGRVTAQSTYFDITTDEGRAAFPGTYQGRELNGSTTGLVSYGFIDVTLSDSEGNPLNLAAGNTAVMTLPAAQGLDTPATIPLWYYSVEDEIWVREGEATYDSASNTYRAEVAHFTAWNLDVPTDRTATVQGCVVNESNQPVSNARTQALGLNWANGDLSTDTQGRFDISVVAGRDFRLNAVRGGTVATSARSYSVAAGERLNVTECLVLRAPAMTITLTWGEHPRDLDSHLVIERVGGAVDQEVYFARDQIDDVFLDTDDVTSFGPEIITVGDLSDGVYTYGVKHYAGESTLSASNLNVTMVIDGQLTRSLSAPAGAVGENDYWTAWRITVNGGQVNIEEVNRVDINDNLHKRVEKTAK